MDDIEAVVGGGETAISTVWRVESEVLGMATYRLPTLRLLLIPAAGVFPRQAAPYRAD